MVKVGFRSHPIQCWLLSSHNPHLQWGLHNSNRTSAMRLTVPGLVRKPVSLTAGRHAEGAVQTEKYLWQGGVPALADREGSRCLFG